MQFAGRPLEDDVSPGNWIVEAVTGREGATVAWLLPPVFEAYARVLHPAVRYVGDEDVEVSWAEVARHNGTAAHARMQWVGITGAWEYARDQDNQPPVWDRAPDEGHLPTDVAARMAAVLRRHTTTPDDCWFGVWSGHFPVPGAALLPMPDREQWLTRGPVELAAANLAEEPHEQSANLWWPTDRRWCVATDVDLMSTYVGGSARCIADLLSAPGLEVFPADPDDPAGYDGDSLNPVPPRP